MYSTYERKNIYKSADEKTLKAIFDYSEGYKRFLDNGKTERETVEYTVEMLEKAGYKEYKLGDKMRCNAVKDGNIMDMALYARVKENEHAD